MYKNSRFIKKKKNLEIILEDVPGHPHPKVELEQYSTPASIAADILWTATNLGDIIGRRVADLGCGTGIFVLGAALLGAEQVWGMDRDRNAISSARETASKMGLSSRVSFSTMDIAELPGKFENKFDTVIQNPPFGSQSRGKRGMDRIFMEKSLQLSPVVYSFHMAVTEDFLEKYWSSLGSRITHKFYYQFPLPKIYYFHQKEIKDIDVIVVRVKRNTQQIYG